MEVNIGKLLQLIPSWLVGLTGALLVLLSTGLSSIFWSSLDEKIRTKQSDLTKLSKKSDLMWGSHQLGDQRVAFSEQLLGMFLVGERRPEFFLTASGYHLRGAVLAMMTAADESDDQGTLQREVGVLERRLSTGDLKAYSELRSKMDELRLKSRDAINDLAEERGTLESDIRELEAKKELVRLFSVALNLLGLIIVMLKDLPVWKTRDGATHDPSSSLG